jgi:hypothetical protein
MAGEFAYTTYDGIKATRKTYYLANGTTRIVKLVAYAQAGNFRTYTITIKRASRIYSFGANPKPSTYPVLSPGGTNRLIFTWRLYGNADVSLDIYNGIEWFNILSRYDLSGNHTYEWDGSFGGNYLLPGRYKARLLATYGDQITTRTFTFDILPEPTVTVKALPLSFIAGNYRKTAISVKWTVISNARVEIFDSSDTLVTTLFNVSNALPTTRTFYWYGRNALGAYVLPGNYKVKATIGGAEPIVLPIIIVPPLI